MGADLLWDVQSCGLRGEGKRGIGKVKGGLGSRVKVWNKDESYDYIEIE